MDVYNLPDYNPFNSTDKIYTSVAGYLIQMVKDETGHYEIWRTSGTLEWCVAYTQVSSGPHKLPSWMTVA